MSLRVERYGDVQRLRMLSLGGRLARIDVSAYVVRGVMIDTGFHHARDLVARAVRELGVRGVVVTHWHEDHAGNAASLARGGIPIQMRDDTAAILVSRPRIQAYRQIIWGRPEALQLPFDRFDADLELVHTPGHSEDHQVVWDAETQTLFSGDLWLGVRARVLHSTEDPYAIVQSVRRAAALEPRRMFDAHRGLVDNATAMLNAKAAWLVETLSAVERRVAEGWSDTEIAKRELGDEGLPALVSRGDYSRVNLVKAVRRHLAR